MANSASAKKRIRVAERNRLRNKMYKGQMKGSISRVEKLIAEGNRDEAIKAISSMQKHVDKAAKAGAIHKNAADRHKSRVTSKLNSL